VSSANEAIGCDHVWKRYGDLIANKDVSLSVAQGSVHAVIGENGAGKSTLMKALYGMSPPDSGEVRLRGQVVARPSVTEALERGVGMVHQHFMLVGTLSVAENVMLGRESFLLDVDAVAAQLDEMSKKYGLAVDPRRRVDELSVGEAQRVEIVKVLWRGAEVLILDEPTAVLTPLEVNELFGVLRQLVAGGKTVVLVTHKLDEVLSLADEVTVMRRGEVVAQVKTKGTSAPELARLMVGREVVATETRARNPVDAAAPLRLSVESLTLPRVGGVSFQVRRGEILGVAGVEGNGQTELALALAGVLPVETGRVLLDGHDVTSERVRARQRRGLAHIPEDRHGRGLVLPFTVEDNLLLGREDHYARALALDFARLHGDTLDLIGRYDVRPPEAAAPAAALSGGNQQKVVVGRELLRKPSVILCAQPTRGVDVGAIERIHEELLAARAAGCAILLFSAELDELIALADRIAVMFRGRLVGIVDNADRRAPRERLGSMMLGAA
jgi:general nucleoside transport system ATP-binding protein